MGYLLSGLQRFIPRLRHKLPTSLRYLKNWETTLSRRRALPFSPVFGRALAGVALARSRFDLAAICLSGFACLLRTREAVCLTPWQLSFLPGPCVMLTLRNTKTAGRHGGVEHIRCCEHVVIKALRLAALKGPAGRPLYTKPARCFGEELRWLAGLLGVYRSDVLPYGLRRGGACAHMGTHTCIFKKCPNKESLCSIPP